MVALVLAVSGVAKLIDPSGTLPRSLDTLTEHLPREVWMRLLGALELVLAIGLARRRWRRSATYLGFTLLVLFSALVALNAHDERFLADCGCMGAVPTPALAKHLGHFAYAVLRNALLCVLLALSVYLLHPERYTWKESTANSFLVGVVLVLGVFYVGERQRRTVVEARAGAREVAMRLSLRHGYRLPKFPLEDEGGAKTSSRSAFGPGDHVVFFTPHCAICPLWAPSWRSLDRRLREQGRRIVLVAVGESEDVAEFKERNDLTEIPHFVARDVKPLLRLGLRGVPQMLVLDDDARVVLNEGLGRGATFADSLDRLAALVEDVDEEVWARIVQRLFGADAVLEEPLPTSGTVRVASVRGAEGEDLRLAVVQAIRRPVHYLEVAVGLRGEDEVVGILPLATGDWSRILSPRLPDLEEFEGRTLEACREVAWSRGREMGIEGPFWRELASLLRHLRLHTKGQAQTEAR